MVRHRRHQVETPLIAVLTSAVYVFAPFSPQGVGTPLGRRLAATFGNPPNVKVLVSPITLNSPKPIT